MANRREFSKKTKRLAMKRSRNLCEAVGAMYGHDAGKRCNASLAYGVQYDHVVLDANSHDNSLENCAAVCIKCHAWKTAHHDIPMAAKTVRMEDKAVGIRTRPVQKIPKRPPVVSERTAARNKDKLPIPERKRPFYAAKEETQS